MCSEERDLSHDDAEKRLLPSLRPRSYFGLAELQMELENCKTMPG